MTSEGSILYREAALADGSGPALKKGVSVLVGQRRIVWIRPTTDEGPLPPDVRVIDAGGSTIVPGMTALWRVWRVAWLSEAAAQVLK